MQTIDEVKKHCRVVGKGIAAFVAEVDKSKLTLREAFEGRL